jgi:hypothetical protein
VLAQVPAGGLGTDEAAAIEAAAARATAGAARPQAGDTPPTVVQPAPVVPVLTRDRGDRLRELGARPWPVWAAVAAVAFAALLGYLLAGSPEKEPDTTGAVVGSGFVINPPDGWSPSDSAAQVPGLDLESPRGAAPIGTPPGGGGLTAGIAADGSALYPSRVAARIDPEDTPQPDAVRLGRVEAWRFRGLETDDGAGVTLFVAPTDDGALAIACVAPSGSGAGRLAECERTAGGLNVTELTAFRLGPVAAYASELNRTLRELDGRRRRGNAALRDARTPGGQARLARDLAGYHRAAADRLARAEGADAAGPAGDAVVSALRDIRTTYRQLANAAADEDSGAYSRASRALGRAQSRLGRAIAAL